MKDTKTIAAKRAFCTLLFPILVASAGCTTTDNKVGSLGHDARVADGLGQDASGAPAQPADGPILADAAVPDAASAIEDVAQESTPADRAVPDAASAVKDAAPDSPSPDGVAPDAASAVKDTAPDSPSPDGAAPDAASAVKDVAPDAPEAGAAHQCQLNANGTCTAVTSNTTCTPFPGFQYEMSAGCYFANPTTLGCCASAAGEFCSLPTASGCYQVATAGGTFAYWTPALATAAVTIPSGQACDQTTSAKIASASLCRATSPDAAVAPDAATPDAHVPVNLPLCATDDDCCVTVDSCTATATLGGKAGWGPVQGTHASPGTCIGCIPPAVQVQCQNGFCVGKRILNSYYAPLLVSHCGHVALPDAGATPSALPHAAVDGGTGVESYQTSWGCH